MKKLFCAFVFLFLTVPCLAKIIIVDNEWPYDFNNIQAAIEYSSNGDFIFVFPGTYTGTGNRDIDFLGKAITVRSIDPTDPCFVSNTIIDCNGIDIYDRHHGFLFQSGEDANSVLAGFTITNARYDAIICGSYSSPIITNCVITKNTCAFRGGAISCSGNPAIINCIISDNNGSGICREQASTNSPMIITDCIISGNIGYGRSSSDGGGISVLNGLCLIYNSVITGNASISGRGGGIYCEGYSQVTATSCTITGNSAKYDGGGIFSSSSGISKVTNCTITGNSAEHNGGGICLAGSSSSISVTNSIIWANIDTSGQGLSAQIYSGTPQVWFSCIKDDNPNDDNIPFDANNRNIDDDPCFVSPGFWDVNVWHNGDYHLLPNSPCIETGNPLFTYHAGDVDMDGQPRLMGRYVDMGADEFELSVITVTKPQAGDVWVTGSTHEINWDSYTITGTVDIYYSTNNGADWTQIANTPDTGTFLWNLPGAVDSNQCLVSVEPNIPIPNLTCIDSGLFTIHKISYRPPLVPKWKSLGGNFDRSGLSQNYGPELGCVKWQFHTDAPVSASPTISIGGRVHLACEDGKLYTLNANNGQLSWSYDTNSPLLSSPTIGRDGVVYVGAENGKLYAVNFYGYLRWTHSTDGPIYSSPAVSPNGNVYACSQDGTLYALGQDGSELWTFETAGSGPGTTGAIFASPAIGPDGTIYIAGLNDPNLYALDPNTGSVKWNRPFNSFDSTGRRPRPFASPVIAADGTIYQTLLNNPTFYAINPNDGNIIWSANLADPNYAYKYVWSEPALGPDGTIYANLNDPYLRAVDPNGSIKWVTRLGVMGGFTLTIGSNGLIYAASDDAYLCVLDPDGNEIARFKGGNWLTSPVITADNTMLVCDANNTVWAIGGVGCEGQAAALHRPQDLSKDWYINLEDLALIANDWLKQYPGDGIYLTGDIDRDLYVDSADLAELADNWLAQE